MQEKIRAELIINIHWFPGMFVDFHWFLGGFCFDSHMSKELNKVILLQFADPSGALLDDDSWSETRGGFEGCSAVPDVAPLCNCESSVVAFGSKTVVVEDWPGD